MVTRQSMPCRSDGRHIPFSPGCDESSQFADRLRFSVTAYVRRFENETVLVVNNLSSAAQAVEIDLRRFKGSILVEMFGKNIFPRAGDLPYLLTLGPYQFYWFRLRRI
jgi:hypothetical protein